jgi:hypothetical protein
VDQLNQLYEEYKNDIDFVAIYISEAHAQDVWPIGSEISCVKAHKTIEDRTNAATAFVKKYNLMFPMLIDEMDDDFDKKYAAWPDRFFLIDNYTVEKISQSKNYEGYSRGEMIHNLFYKQNKLRGNVEVPVKSE